MIKNTWLTRLYLVVLVLSLAACGGGDDSSTETDDDDTIEYTSADQYLTDIGFVGTALIQKNGVDIVRKAYGYADKDANTLNSLSTRFRLGSLTKSFTAMAVVQLKRQGFIETYDDYVMQYLPDYPNGDMITIRHLLTHSSGIPDYLPYVNSNNNYTPETLVNTFKDRALLFTPGSTVSYSNSNYALLGYLIEQLTQVSYASYLQTAVLTPLGLSSTEYGQDSSSRYAQGYEDYEANEDAAFFDMSIPYAAGALVSNLLDMETWGLALLSQQLASASDYAEIFPTVANDGYFYAGFGWFVGYLEDNLIYQHGGDIEGFTTFMALYPEQNGLLILLSNQEGASDERDQIFEEVTANEF